MHINATIHLHVDDPTVLRAVREQLGLALDKLNRVIGLGETQEMASVELKAAIALLDAATNNLAADIQRLKDKISSSMSAADVADVQSTLDSAVARLQGLANDPDNPDPAPAPAPVPEPAPAPEPVPEPEPEPPAQA